MNNRKAKQLRREASAKATNSAVFENITVKRKVKGAVDGEGKPVQIGMAGTSSWQEGTARRLYQDSKFA